MNGPVPPSPAAAGNTSSTTSPVGGANAAARTIPVPTGSRDMLPEEMAELREISAAALRTFADAGYGEVATPAFEYEETMRIADPSAADRAYRVSDKDGRAMVARFDSTIPIARLAATRYRDAEPPLRFCYQQHVYRPIEPKRAQSREFLQIGAELLGAGAPDGDAEAIALLCRVLEAAGLSEFQIAVGDVSFITGRLARAGLSDPSDAAMYASVVHELQTRDLVGLRRELSASGLGDAADEVYEIATARGGVDVLERYEAERLGRLAALIDAAGAADRVIYDLGLVRQTSYYTGTVLEVYAPSSGFPIAGGGRYDELVGKFGRDLEAFGFAINVERLHLALLAEREQS